MSRTMDKDGIDSLRSCIPAYAAQALRDAGPASSGGRVAMRFLQRLDPGGSSRGPSPRAHRRGLPLLPVDERHGRLPRGSSEALRQGPGRRAVPDFPGPAGPALSRPLLRAPLRGGRRRGGNSADLPTGPSAARPRKPTGTASADLKVNRGRHGSGASSRPSRIFTYLIYAGRLSTATPLSRIVAGEGQTWVGSLSGSRPWSKNFVVRSELHDATARFGRSAPVDHMGDEPLRDDPRTTRSAFDLDREPSVAR